MGNKKEQNADTFSSTIEESSQTQEAMYCMISSYEVKERSSCFTVLEVRVGVILRS